MKGEHYNECKHIHMCLCVHSTICQNLFHVFYGFASHVSPMPLFGFQIQSVPGVLRLVNLVSGVSHQCLCI